MFAIFLKTINERIVSLTAYFVFAVLLLVMFMSLYPSIQENSKQLNELFQSYPQGLKDALGLEGLNFDTVEKFLSIQYFGFMWPMLVIVITISVGASLAREKEEGTISILFSRPLSRLKIFFAQYIAGVSILAIFSFVSVFVGVFIASVNGIEYIFKNFLSIGFLGFLLGISILTISTFFSSVFSEKSRVLIFTGGLTLCMYTLNLLANLKESLEGLKYFSFFHYYNPSVALAKGELEFSAITVFLLVTLVFLTSGAYIFNKKDV